MQEALELIRQGDGWNAAITGMGAVFVSLIILVIFIKVFAAIIKSAEARRERRGEAVEAKPSPPPEDVKFESDVAPEVAAAISVALAGSDRQEEVVAAVSYAIHNHLHQEAAPLLPAAAGEGNGKGSNPWSIAGRMRLMNDRARMLDRGRGR